MRKNLLWTAIVAMAASSSPMYAFTSETFEEGGLWYQTYQTKETDSNGEQTTVTFASVISPQDGSQYTGEGTLEPTVTHGGETYPVAASTSAFNFSSVTQFTLGEGFDRNNKSSYSTLSITLINDDALERLNLKSIVDSGEGDVSGRISVGKSTECVNVYLRNYGESSEVVIDKFNVYGPDGKKLVPFLLKGAGESRDKANAIYADENGVFHLGKDYQSIDGQYCGILPLYTGVRNAYTIVVLFVEYEGKMMYIRTQPAPTQSGLYTEYNGLRYEYAVDEAVVVAPAAGKNYTGEITIPETIEYQGKTAPVTQIADKAFEGTEISSITLGSNLQIIGNRSFAMCNKLERADLTKTGDILWDRNAGTSLFYKCEALKSVQLPVSPNFTYIPATMFKDCKSLKTIKLPSLAGIGVEAFANCESLETVVLLPGPSTKIGNLAFANCISLKKLTLYGGEQIFGSFTGSGLVSMRIIENTDEYVIFSCDTELSTPDGAKVPLFAYSYDYFNQDGVRPSYYGSNNIYMVPKSELYNKQGVYTGCVAFYFDPKAGNLLPEVDLSKPYGYSLFYVYLPQETSGIDDTPAVHTGPATTEYYNLQGVKVSNPSAGIYLRRCGDKVDKVIVR